MTSSMATRNAAMFAEADRRLIDVTRESPRVLLYFVRRNSRYHDSVQVGFCEASPRRVVGSAFRPRRWRSDGPCRVRCVSRAAWGGSEIAWEAHVAGGGDHLALVDWPNIEAGDALEVTPDPGSPRPWRADVIGLKVDVPAAEALRLVREAEATGRFVDVPPEGYLAL